MDRYHRQKLVLDGGAQKKLEKSSVAIIGVGALGTVAAELLTRAGVNLVLVDRDVVEITNLQRQLLFCEEDVGKSKAHVAKKKLQKINSDVTIQAHAIHLSNKNIEVLEEVDLILDCTDNMNTRFLINEYCKKNSKNWIYSAAIRQSGYVMLIMPDGPCLSCFLSGSANDTCDTVGVLNTITTSIAALQVQIAIKMLSGQKIESMLYRYDLEKMDFRKLKVNKKQDCGVCNGVYAHLASKDNLSIVQFCKSGKYQIQGVPKNFDELREKWSKADIVEADDTTLRFKNILLFKDGRALIKAKSEQEARSEYSKWVGD